MLFNYEEDYIRENYQNEQAAKDEAEHNKYPKDVLLCFLVVVVLAGVLWATGTLQSLGLLP